MKIEFPSKETPITTIYFCYQLISDIVILTLETKYKKQNKIMSATVAKPRLNLPSKVGIGLSTARIRRWLDRNGLNKLYQTEIDKCDDYLKKMKQAGGPANPGAAPKKLESQDDAAFNVVYNTWKTSYDNYKNFYSAEYNKVFDVYVCYKLLRKLSELLRHTDPSKKVSEEILGLTSVLQDKPRPQRSDEDAAKYQKYCSEYVKTNYASLCKDCNLENPSSIESCLNDLREAHADLQQFLRKEEMSHLKVRFNDAGILCVVTGCEAITTECIKYAIQSANSEEKKIIQPDHIISGKIHESPLFCMFESLPHYQALVARDVRRVKHAADDKAKRVVMTREAREKARAAGKTYTVADRPDFTVLKTFEEQEVLDGYARKDTVKPGKKAKNSEERDVYLWKGIDKDESPDDDDTNFEFYITALYNKVKTTVFAENPSAGATMKISKSIKQFLSKQITDFLALLAPIFRILIDYNNVKTIDKKTVVAAYKLLLCDNYESRDGLIDWTTGTANLFSDIQNRLDTWELLSQSQKEDAVDADDPLDPEVPDTPVSVPEVPAQPSVAENATKSVVTRRNIPRRR